jgi:altronate hydrolase
MPKFINLDTLAVVVDLKLDNVAVAKKNIEKGTFVAYRNEIIKLNDSISAGERFAISKIKKDDFLIQYGYPFAQSIGISEGDKITNYNTKNKLPEIGRNYKFNHPPTFYLRKYIEKIFLGYKRVNGLIGTRNYYLVVPTSMCASETASQIVDSFDERKIKNQYPNIDGIVAIPNTEGCGCAGGLQIDRFIRVLKNTISHPNVGGALIVDLGCEQTNYTVIFRLIDDKVELSDRIIDWITIQHEGGIHKTIEKAIRIINSKLKQVNKAERKSYPIEGLVLGAECGASDAFSGITANSVIGNVVDKIIFGKGGAIFSEMPEMVGAEGALFQKMRSRAVMNKFKEAMAWYKDVAHRLNATMDDNLVPENKAGGLMNAYIKSLGAVVKGGTTIIEDFINYGERIRKRGLSIMQGPGNDPESVTGLVASGANIICFSTGKGAVTGNAIVPVIKISSTSNLYQRMEGDIDFDAGRLLKSDSKSSTLEELGEQLLDLIIEVASGKETKTETMKQRQFQVWTAGKLSL